MDWGRGYTALWRVYRVDESTWADGSRVDGITSVSVERDRGETNQLMESGTFVVDTAPTARFESGYYRIVLYPQQDGMADRVDVATLYCQSSHKTNDRGRASHDVHGDSVLYPASVRKLAAGSYFPKGAGCMAQAARLLRQCLAAPVTIDGTSDPVLATNVVFDAGVTALEAVSMLLAACNCIIQLHGDGTVHLMRMPSKVALVLDRANARLLEPAVQSDYDLTGVPNRFYAEQNGLLEHADNDDQNSEVSHRRRGYWHDEYDGSPVRVDGETLYGFCRRRLEEMSVAQDKRTYTRKWWPDVYPGSIVRGSMPSVSLDGDMRVQRQSIDCAHGISVTEEAAKEVALWRR